MSRPTQDQEDPTFFILDPTPPQITKCYDVYIKSRRSVPSKGLARLLEKQKKLGPPRCTKLQ